MKFLSQFSALIVAGTFGIFAVSCAPKRPVHTAEEALSFSKSLAPGWNLGNSFDGVAADGVANETAWGNGACTQATMDSLASYGYACVRVPISYIGHIGEAPDYTLDAAWLDRIGEVIGYAKQAGLKVIINIHHDGNPDVARQQYWLDICRASQDSAYHAGVKTELAAVWGQVAKRFANEPVESVIFEALNEIHDGGYGNTFRADSVAQFAALNDWMQVFVDAVRATGGLNTDRYLAVTSYYAKVRWACEALVLPNDPTEHRLMVAVHSYDPWWFAGTGEQHSWGHNGQYGTTEQELENMMKALNDRFVAQGVPVYMGEYGAVTQVTEQGKAFQRYYTEYYNKAGKTYGIPCILWDNGYDIEGEDAFGYINHATGEFIREGKAITEAIMKAWKTEDEAYTLESIYQAAPVCAVGEE